VVDLVRADVRRHGWTVWEGNQPVDFADAEVGDDGIAGVAVHVRKLARGRGLGTASMRAVGPVAREVGAVRIKGGVRVDNSPSLKAALASGGEVVGVDKDRYIEMLGPPL
jgi:GNAT superfamily N-acetyltransferase